MKKATELSTIIALLANVILFILKIIGGLYSGSIALISDAMNSFTDIIASISLIFCVKISHKRADVTHPFGHHRAEPIGGLIVAVIAALLGFEVIKESILSIFKENLLQINYWIYAIVIFTIVLKLSLYIFFNKLSKKHNRPSIRALAYDSINDVLVSGLVLINFILYNYSVLYIDSILGIIIGIWIIINGLKIGFENIDYLMGKKPSEKIIKKIKKRALQIKGVKGLNDIFAHYVGHYVHVEVHIELDDKTILKNSHDIGKKVQKRIEKLKEVDRVFVHIDPIKK